MTNPATLNNKAACRIYEARYDEAVAMLTKALKTVKLIMSGDAMLTELLPEEQQESLDSSFRCEFVSSGSSSFERTVQGGLTGESSIFREPVQIKGQLPYNELEKCELLSYTILYNLALSYHLKAMARGSETMQVPYLRKAIALYEHAHHILMNQEVEVSLIHTMAIASNLGQIHRFLGNEERSSMCFKHLLSTILYVVDCGEGSKIEALDGFFRNVMPLISIGCSAPAA